MKNILTILTVLLLFAIPAKATVDNDFEKANELYKAGAYSEAIDMYNSVLAQGYTSAALYYNLGNAYFRTDNIGAAILNYERALKINPNDEEIVQNLEYVNNRTLDKINKVPELFITKWFNSVLNWFSLSQWGGMCVCFMVLLCLCVVVFFLTHSYLFKQISFYSGLVALLFFILSVVNASVVKSRKENMKQAIVMEPTVVVKSSPEENSADKFIIHEGCKLTIEDNLNNWCKVKLGDGNTGWVENNVIENI
ncbi:MAG: tetratricopeptide repeat protein [Bacteroidales bacterium]|nr:tetratricopeptide repeat protein [Bacteroidales bacterium]